jgi:hypothetical protein
MPVDRNTAHDAVRKSFAAVERQLGGVPTMLITNYFNRAAGTEVDFPRVTARTAAA